MMKNAKKLLVLVVIGFLFVSGTAYAGAFVKLGRGLTNLVTAPAELLHQPFDLGQTHNIFVAWFGGLPKGIIFIPIRAAVGVYDIATFPIPFPNHYGPLMKPETLIEGFNPE